MKRIGITFILALLPLVSGLRCQEPVIHTAPQINECLPPVLEEMDDYFKINPTLRQQYYLFLARDFSQLYTRSAANQDITTPDAMRYQGQFRLFVSDFFKNNHELVVLAEQLAVNSEAPREQIRHYKFKENIKDIEKISNRLAKKVSLLLPVEMESGFEKDGLTKYYRKMISEGHMQIMFRILLVKINSLQSMLCDFFFPATFTVSLDNLGSRRTPKHELEEIRLIADLLRKRFPSKGLPSKFK